MSNLIVIVVCLIMGALARRVGGFSRSQVKPLNTVILWVSLPALVLAELPSVFNDRSQNATEIFCLALMAWLVFALALIAALVLLRSFGWSRATCGCIALTAGLGNTSFVGYPLIELLMGKEALRYAVVADQLGSFFALSTAGLFAASYFSARSWNPREITKRMMMFPPLLAVVGAVIWALLDLPRDGFFQSALERIAMTLVPLALLSVGWQLDFSPQLFSRRWREAAVGLALKLVLAPVLIYAIFALVLDREGVIFKVAVLEAAMAPMITAGVVATEFDLDGELAQLLLGIGIPLSLLTVPAWSWLLR